MSKIKDYFGGEKDERIRQGTYKAEAYAFRFLLVFLIIAISIKFFFLNSPIEGYVDELAAVLIAGSICYFVLWRERIVEKSLGILTTLFQSFLLTILSGYYHYHFGELHYKNRSTSDFILFLFGSFITYLLVLGVFNWFLNKYNQHRRDKIDMEMEDSE